MGDTHHRNHHQDAAEATSSKFGPRKMGEIVEVQGGHIVRATGRKDRHSKVCTAKGPRDRRVRLSAHTAIQFYDVQDRLGYDRPSKAVDWLIKKAKAAIDELAELPPWSPTTATAAAGKSRARSAKQDHDIGDYGLPVEGSRRRTTVETTEEMVHMTGNANANPNDNDSGFLPPSLDSDAIADTIKSFFPVGASAVTSSSPSPVPFYPPDLLSRTSSQSQDLRLSLQSFREPILLNPHHHHAHAQEEQQVLFSGDGAGGHHFGFDGWPDHPHQQHQAEINRFQRMIAWNNNAGDACSGDGGGGFIFNHQPPPSPPPQPFFGQNQFFTQRGPLQSSNTPSFRAWIDPVIVADQHQLHHIPQIHQQPLISGMEFAAAPGGVFSGFRVPARIQGHVEEHDGIHNKPSSASSASRH